MPELHLRSPTGSGRGGFSAAISCPVGRGRAVRCGAADMDGYVAVALGDDAPTPHPVQSSSPLPSGKGGPRPLRARLAREFLSGGSMCHGLRVFCFGSSVRSSKRVMIRIHKRTDHIRLLLYKSQASFPFFSFFFSFFYVRKNPRLA